MRNSYRIEGEVTYIVVTSKSYGIHEALIDTEDLDKVKVCSWSYSTSKSRCPLIKGANKKYLHRLITDCPDGLEVDHMNFNGLDNRKANLRVCTRAENAQNKQVPKNSKTGVRGVTIVPRGLVLKYSASVGKRFNGVYKKIFQEYFPYTPEGLRQATEAVREVRMRLLPFSNEQMGVTN